MLGQPSARSSAMEFLRSLSRLLPRVVGLPRRTLCTLARSLTPGARPVVVCGRATQLLRQSRAAPLCASIRLRVAGTALPAPQPGTQVLRCPQGPDPTARPHPAWPWPLRAGLGPGSALVAPVRECWWPPVRTRRCVVTPWGPHVLAAGLPAGVLLWEEVFGFFLVVVFVF